MSLVGRFGGSIIGGSTVLWNVQLHATETGALPITPLGGGGTTDVVGGTGTDVVGGIEVVKPVLGPE